MKQVSKYLVVPPTHLSELVDLNAVLGDVCQVEGLVPGGDERNMCLRCWPDTNTPGQRQTKRETE